MGFQGYPTIEISYLGPDESMANEVVLELVLEEGSEPLAERFTTVNDIRQDETIQSAIVKMIERSGAQSVILNESVKPNEER